MNESLFIEVIQKFWTAVTSALKIKYNGEREAKPYLYERQLRQVFSPTLKWDSLSLDRAIVAADVVALDSEKPLKSRPSVRKASGDIPKIAIKRYKDEKELAALRSLMLDPRRESELARQLIAEPADFVSRGMKERIEYMWLQALSTGLCVVPDEENAGTGIRVDFGLSDEHKFGAGVAPWGQDGATPISDIARVITAASSKGYTITRIMSNLDTFNQARNSAEGKSLVAGYLGLQSIDRAVSSANFNAAFTDEYKVVWEVVDRSVIVEKNGVRIPTRPFADGVVSFLTSDQAGELYYAPSVEDTFPTAGVEYANVAPYITVMQYSKTDPKREWTAAEGFAIPIVDVEGLFILDTQEAQELSATEVEGDANVTIYGQSLVKADVIAALNAMGVRTSASISDANLIIKVNGLNDKQEADLKTALSIS